MKKLVSIIFLGAILIACGPEKPKEKTDGEDSHEIFLKQMPLLRMRMKEKDSARSKKLP